MKDHTEQNNPTGKASRNIVGNLLLVATSLSGACIMANPVLSSNAVSTWEWAVFGLLLAAFGFWRFFVLWPTDEDLAALERNAG